MKKYLMLVLCTMLSIGLITGCGNKKEDKKDSKEENGEVSKKIDTCPNCVYAYYYTEKKYGEDGDVLTDYTTDYTTLKNSQGNKREVFLGHILDENNKIIRAFVCFNGVDKAYCLEGTTDGSKYKENEKIINEIYDGGYCNGLDDYIVCTDDKSLAEASGDGNVQIDNNAYPCYVNNLGNMRCFNN